MNMQVGLDWNIAIGWLLVFTDVSCCHLLREQQYSWWADFSAYLTRQLQTQCWTLLIFHLHITTRLLVSAGCLQSSSWFTAVIDLHRDRRSLRSARTKFVPTVRLSTVGC